jgi:hypothetical protein
MEPTSSPDNTRSNRGLARFWPVHREGEDEATESDSTELPATLSSETEMVALGSRRASELSGPPGSPVASATPAPGPEGKPAEGPKPPLSSPSSPSRGPLPPAGSGLPVPSARPEPAPAAHHGPANRDSDHSDAAEQEDDTAADVESARANPWDRDPATFGGFGLGGRNGRFLFGGRNPMEPRHTGLNGHSHPEVNGRASTVDDPEQAAGSDENGRDDMNGRIPMTGDSGPLPVSGPPGAADDIPEARRQATGWASVPTSKHPVVEPTSGAPVSGAPSSGAPTSGAPVSSSPVSPDLGFGGGYGQPPSYTPALPDPTSGPVSGVPAPRAAAASIPVPAAPPSKSPATFGNDTPPVSPPKFVSGSDSPISFGGDTQQAAEEDSSSPRRSASLEDAEPVRRGRRAAPEEPEGEKQEDAPLRPGDVAAGHIAFWDEDAVRHFRAAWHEVKAEFVDDPEAALTRAHDLLTDAVNELTEALLAERDELDPLRGNKSPDTESMRMAMRGYREFLDRIMAH